MPIENIPQEILVRVATCPALLELFKQPEQPLFNEKVRWCCALDDFKTLDNDMLRVKERARILANEPDSVIVTGESGTGKELIANILHGTRKGNFVAVNSTAVT